MLLLIQIYDVTIFTSNRSENSNKIKLKQCKITGSIAIHKRVNSVNPPKRLKEISLKKSPLKSIKLKGIKLKKGVSKTRKNSPASTKSQQLDTSIKTPLNNKRMSIQKFDKPHTVVVNFTNIQRIVDNVKTHSELKNIVIMRKDVPLIHERKINSNDYVMYCYM